MKIIVVSDNHGDRKVLKRIVEMSSDADYFIHCGDSQMMAHELLPFVSVKGNNDYEPFAGQRILTLTPTLKLIYLHGDKMSGYNRHYQLIDKAKQNDCQIICYGHTHVADQSFDEGIYILNPGSTTYPRSSIGPSYMEIEVDEEAQVVTHLKLL